MRKYHHEWWLGEDL